MASLMPQDGRFYCQFMYHGKRHCFALGHVDREEAEAKVQQAGYLLMRLGQGLLTLPVGMDIVTFLRFDGKTPEEAPAPRGAVTLGKLRDRYLEVHRGSLEQTTIAGIELHFGHLVALLGAGFPLKDLGQDTLQTYATKRGQMKWRGKPIRSATIKKELVTLRTAWNWGAGEKLVSGRFPSLRKIRLAKSDEKPPFQTWQEIERRIALGGLTKRQIGELWDALYLRQEDIADLLKHVKEKARLPWVYPLFCTAAYTGMRRSELLRVQVADVDLPDETILVHEKKRAHDKTTTRRVVLAPLLKQVLQDWLSQHPGGPTLFCQPVMVARSKKRSRTTGHKGQKERATTAQGRLAGVRERGSLVPGGLTRNEAHDHFKRTLAGSKWEVVRGWHIFRHSFISLCASKGVDQRLIDEWVGHQTDEQRKRYRHLLPSVQKDAIRSVFGETQAG